MKKLIVLAMVSAVLAGCDDAPAPDAFTPEMASFSNEFDFDPLRGPVKDFSQTLMNEEDKVALRVTGTLSIEGCFETLDFHDVESNTGASLVLNANFYLDSMTQEKRVKLQGKCQLAELSGTGLVYETDDKGFVVAARNSDAEIRYRYDSEGYPLGRTAKSKDKELSVEATVSSDAHKKHDYTAETTLNGEVVGRANQSCRYDSHFNPVSCELVMTDVSVTPNKVQKFTIKNIINYY
ncbi:YnfC family lipoprotein [Siccibacter turicensis]|uniref:YnfC family lipoprotein n=1 Tax=Siccibacter turicensis TaxID=357233 RepID=UPI002A6A7D48|nr:YnfC family lipoprotein [Siccibacter turicensis]MDY0970806.1 YnfC family lipoprotein [Siccibacter turicensis]